VSNQHAQQTLEKLCYEYGEEESAARKFIVPRGAAHTQLHHENLVFPFREFKKKKKTIKNK
jgi:hypothetical protein